MNFNGKVNFKSSKKKLVILTTWKGEREVKIDWAMTGPTFEKICEVFLRYKI